MTEKTSGNFLESERKNTDDSLDAERTKTNSSLLNAREKTENQIDSEVQADRSKADVAKATARSEVDARNIGKSNPKTEGRVNNERARADDAMKTERSKVDAVIGHERELKSALMTKLLEQERLLTDTNLSHERSCTDEEVSSAAVKLTSEIDLHAKTKTSLTSRDEFVAIVSHDLKNPIGAAYSCAKMLLEDPSYAIDGELKHWVSFIKRNIDTSLRLIGDLLDLERIAVGKLHVAKRPTLLEPLLNEAVESYSHVAKDKTISLTVTDCDSNLEANLDRDRIAQVLSNLIGNSMKFTPKSGSVLVTATCDAKDLIVSITDNGPGIDDAKKMQIFERFAQLNAKDRQGLGLGLYISKMLVEAHGGRLWVDSKLGEGSAFSFAIPLT